MLQPVKKKKLAEVVADQIMETIRCGFYPKGELLPSEKELVRIYKVSRITMRESLKMLAESGVIVTKQGKGSYVAVDRNDLRVNALQTGTLSELKEIYHYSMEIRIMVEPIAAAKVARMQPDDTILARVITAYERMRVNPKENPIDRLTPDEEFHMEIIKLLGNPVLTDWIGQLQTLENTTQQTKLPRLENQLDFMRENYEKHGLILGALRSGNEESAFFYMKQHLIELSEHFKQYFDGLSK